MDESTAFRKVCTWLEDRDYRVFIDVPSQYHNHSEYDEVTDRWPHHQITISGYRPDILGFTPSGRVFAVEVKGSKHIRKGFGQAAGYLRGVDHAYLAAHHEALRGLTSMVQANGIGVFAVSGNDVTVTHPHTVDLKDELANTRQQLEALLTAPSQDSTFLPNYVDPLNNLLPVVAVSAHNCTTRDNIADICERLDYPYRSKIGRMIRLARNLGLVDESEPIELTAQGKLGWAVLQTSGIESISDLMEAKHASKGRASDMATIYPEVATLLRNRFAAVPAYRSLFEILIRYPGSSITLLELGKRLVENYPTTFLNLAYSDYSDDRGAPRLIGQGRIEEIYTDTDYLAQILNTNFTYNLPGQLTAIGVLADGTDAVDTKSDLNPASDQLVIGDFQLN